MAIHTQGPVKGLAVIIADNGAETDVIQLDPLHCTSAQLASVLAGTLTPTLAINTDATGHQFFTMAVS